MWRVIQGPATVMTPMGQQNIGPTTAVVANEKNNAIPSYYTTTNPEAMRSAHAIADHLNAGGNLDKFYEPISSAKN